MNDSSVDDGGVEPETGDAGSTGGEQGDAGRDAGPQDSGLANDAGLESTLSVGLHGWYRFDDEDSGTRLLDDGPFAAHGFLGAPNRIEADAGRSGGALRVLGPGARLGGGLTGAGSFAFSLWFRTFGPVVTPIESRGARLLTNYRGGGDRAASAVLIPGDGTDSVWFILDEVDISAGFVRIVRHADAGLEPSRWHHVAVSYDASGRIIRTSFDGQHTVINGGINSTGSPEIGFLSMPNRSPAQFLGWMDEIRYWRRPLSEAELNALWTNP